MTSCSDIDKEWITDCRVIVPGKHHMCMKEYSLRASNPSLLQQREIISHISGFIHLMLNVMNLEHKGLKSIMPHQESGSYYNFTWKKQAPSNSPCIVNHVYVFKSNGNSRSLMWLKMFSWVSWKPHLQLDVSNSVCVLLSWHQPFVSFKGRGRCGSGGWLNLIHCSSGTYLE